ncbi:MAG: diacylglycerol kinase family lipid kinase [Meiothermus sp.]|nr:diacylglycerol kinase family lipid kinase [Meiothermus sp.]
MTRPVIFVVNPAAGRGRVGGMVGRLEAILAKTGQPYRLVLTQAPGHGVEVARQAPEGSRVVAVGGDGTVHEVVRGLAGLGPGSDKAVGVVPVGSGNDFARMLGLRNLTLEAAVHTAFSGRVRPIDLGMVNGRPFAGSLGIGFDAEVAQKALTAPPLLTGLPRYLYSIFGVLSGLSLPTLSLRSSGATLHQGKALMVALMNGRTYGGGIPVVPGAKFDDGLISGVVAGEFGRLGVLGILPRLLRGTHVGDPRVRLFEGTDFVLDFDRPVPAQADGEALGSAQTYRVGLIPAGLRVIEFSPL